MEKFIMKSDKLMILLIMAVALVGCDNKIPQEKVKNTEKIQKELSQVKSKKNDDCPDDEIYYELYKTRFGTLKNQNCGFLSSQNKLFLNDKLIRDFGKFWEIEEEKEPSIDGYPPILHDRLRIKTIKQYKQQDIVFLINSASGNAFLFEECSLLALDKQNVNFMTFKNCRIHFGDNPKFAQKDNLLYINVGFHHWKNNDLVYDGKKAFLKTEFPKGKQVMDNDNCKLVYKNRRKFCHKNDVEHLGLIPSEVRDYKDLFFGHTNGFNPFAFEKVCDKSKLTYQQFKAKACQINFDDKKLNKDKLFQWTNDEWDY